MLRHGDTDPVTPETPDPGLSDTGAEQVRRTVHRISKDHPVSVIVTDPTKRTQETAHIWAEHTGAKVVTDPRITNWDLGPKHRGRHSAQTDALVSSLVAHREIPPPGGQGESAKMYQSRLFEALGPLIAGHELVGVVNHSRGIRSVESAIHDPRRDVTSRGWHARGLMPHAGAVLVTREKAERL